MTIRRMIIIALVNILLAGLMLYGGHWWLLAHILFGFAIVLSVASVAIVYSALVMAGAEEKMNIRQTKTGRLIAEVSPGRWVDLQTVEHVLSRVDRLPAPRQLDVRRRYTEAKEALSCTTKSD